MQNNVIYLARPCQYVSREESPKCHSRYWSTARYAPAVIESYHDILNALRHQGVNEFHLVGYSGGAPLALILAEQRNDILSVTTVAGNISLKTFSELHHVDYLTESLDPQTFINQLGNVRQQHYIGSEDVIVPISIAQAWQQTLSPTQQNHSKLISVPNVSHHSGWQIFWKKNIATIHTDTGHRSNL